MINLFVFAFLSIPFEDTECFSVSSVVPYILPFFIKLLTVRGLGIMGRAKTFTNSGVDKLGEIVDKNT